MKRSNDRAAMVRNADMAPGDDMGNIRKTITLTDQQDRWIKAQATAGNFSDDGECIREPIRRDQEQYVKFQVLKAAIQEGLDSGVSDKTIPVIMEEVEARLRDDGRLQVVEESSSRSLLTLLPVHFTTVSDFHHQDTHDTVLDVANHPAIPRPITPQSA